MKLVLINWVDSVRLGDGWVGCADIGVNQPVHCRSVGWRTSDEPIDGCWHILPHIQYGTDGKPLSALGGLVIPAVAVVVMVEVESVEGGQGRLQGG
jgi:hypothetical protein